jgi:hypothetical protein
MLLLLLLLLPLLLLLLDTPRFSVLPLLLPAMPAVMLHSGILPVLSVMSLEDMKFC